MVIQTNNAANNALRNLSMTDKLGTAPDREALERLPPEPLIRRRRRYEHRQQAALRWTRACTGTAQHLAGQLSAADRGRRGADDFDHHVDRMKELAVESGSANVTDSDRTKIQAEFSSLQAEITRITTNTKYQGQTLLNGTFGVQDAGTGTLDTPLLVSARVKVSGAAASSTYTIAQTAATSLTMTTGRIWHSRIMSRRPSARSAGGAGVAQTFNFDKLGVGFTYTGTLGATTLNGTDGRNDCLLGRHIPSRQRWQRR